MQHGRHLLDSILSCLACGALRFLALLLLQVGKDVILLLGYTST